MYKSEMARWAGQIGPLSKAVGSGPGLNLNGVAGASGLGDMSSLQLQNLDSVLTSILFTEEQFKLFRSIVKRPSINLNYQYERRLRYGGGRRSPGFIEGGVPAGGTSAWERDSATIRFMGVRRGITQQSIQIGKMGGSMLDPLAEENKNGTMELMEEIERTIYFGQEAIKDSSGRTVNYDGIYQQAINSKVATTNVIDLQGAPMQFETFEEIGRLLFQKYFTTSFRSLKCLASPAIIADFSKLRLNIDRRDVQHGRIPAEVVGAPWKGYDSNFGFIPVEPHIFFERVAGDAPKLSSDGADPGAPAVPAAPTCTAGAAPGSAVSQLKAGSYVYTIGSFNEAGESLPVTQVTPCVATAGQANAIAIAQVTGACGYRIYRGSATNGSDAQWIADAADQGSGGTTYYDMNQKVPGSGTLLLWINEEDAIVIPQFMPLLRWPIAIVSTTIEWFLLLYHTIKIKAPERLFIVTNVGRLS
jgi:hypothetical protein